MQPINTEDLQPSAALLLQGSILSEPELRGNRFTSFNTSSFRASKNWNLHIYDNYICLWTAGFFADHMLAAKSILVKMFFLSPI